jgi:hypothetical protein
MEVGVMITRSTIRKIARSISYGIQRLLLQVYGPGDRQGKHDPIRVLKRKYNRPLDEFEGFHIENETK